MKNCIILVIVLFASCSFDSTKDKWVKEPYAKKYSREREKQVWGRVLRGNDVALFYGTPVQKVAEAIKSGDNSVIKEALKYLSDEEINFKEEKLGITLNKFAIRNSNFEALKILTENGADPNVPSKNGESAFIVSIIDAQVQNDNRYLKYLVEHGGDVNLNKGLLSPLMIASSYKLENVKMLIKAGADPHYIWRNDEKAIVHSALGTAIMHDRIDIVNYLLFDCGVDPNSLTVTHKKTGTWTIIDDVRNMEFKKDDKLSYKKKAKLMNYLRDHGFKLKGEY